MAWLLLIIAGLFEVVWALSLKQSEGFTKIGPTILFGVAAWASFMLLSQAIKSLPIGAAYAAWTGVGAVGVAIAGIVWFEESASLVRIGCILLIVVGIAGLNLTTETKSLL
ncbi:MAG: multidrug efflux SMR transporter [Pseudomonadota bacterium]